MAKLRNLNVIYKFQIKETKICQVPLQYVISTLPTRNTDPIVYFLRSKCTNIPKCWYYFISVCAINDKHIKKRYAIISLL